MGKSTQECRKDCDVYEAWKQMEDAQVGDILKIQKLQAELNKHIVNNLTSIDRIHGLQDKIRKLRQRRNLHNHKTTAPKQLRSSVSSFSYSLIRG